MIIYQRVEMTDCSKNEKIFIDTAPFIYFFEGNYDLSIKTRDILFNLLNGNYEIYTSYVTEVEMKVMPQRNKQFNKLVMMDNFFDEFAINKLNIGLREYKIALDIRAEYASIKLIDAFQLSMALNAKCDYFLTNDKELKKFKQIKVVLIDEYAKIITKKQ